MGFLRPQFTKEVMNKYYAVKKGFIPDIYRSWGDCRKQVHRFPGAKYKSFKTLDEAEDFMDVKVTEENKIEDIERILASNWSDEQLHYPDLVDTEYLPALAELTAPTEQPDDLPGD